jgi:hypothetical protein
MNNFEDLDTKRVKLDDSGACDVGDEEKEGTEDDNDDDDEKGSEIAAQEEESETDESETEKVTESEWDWARRKCRITIARKLAKKRGVSNVSNTELNKFIKGKLGWITRVLWKYDFEFVDSEMLDECCKHLGFEGGILDHCTILSFAMPDEQSIYSLDYE